jgi:hypothetical protein
MGCGEDHLPRGFPASPTKDPDGLEALSSGGCPSGHLAIRENGFRPFAAEEGKAAGAQRTSVREHRPSAA